MWLVIEPDRLQKIISLTLLFALEATSGHTLSIIYVGQSDYWKEGNVGGLWKEPYAKNKQLRPHMATDMAQFYSTEKNHRLCDNAMG